MFCRGVVTVASVLVTPIEITTFLSCCPHRCHKSIKSRLVSQYPVKCSQQPVYPEPSTETITF